MHRSLEEQTEFSNCVEEIMSSSLKFDEAKSCYGLENNASRELTEDAVVNIVSLARSFARDSRESEPDMDKVFKNSLFYSTVLIIYIIKF
jgi:hypothetical protein